MRLLRLIIEGAIYYVFSAINYNIPALFEPEFKQELLDFIVKAKTKFDFELFEFSILNNCIRLLIKPGEGESISKIMQWIKCNFAKWWNKKHGLKGHLWGERFYSRIISDEKDFEAVRKLIAESPVKARLVKKARKWVFGGLYHRLHRVSVVIDRVDVKKLFPSGTSPPGSGVGIRRNMRGA